MNVPCFFFLFITQANMYSAIGEEVYAVVLLSTQNIHTQEKISYKKVPQREKRAIRTAHLSSQTPMIG